MNRFFFFAALSLATISCTPETAPDGSAINPLWPSERQECVREGGRWGRGGILRLEMCFPSYSDGGKSCAKASDCEGICLADTRQCSDTFFFGCYSYLEDNGEAIEICVD